MAANLSQKKHNSQFGNTFNQEYHDRNQEKSIQHADWLNDSELLQYVTAEHIRLYQRYKRYGYKKLRPTLVRLIKLKKQLERIANCGKFTKEIINYETGEVKTVFLRCNSPLCTNCAQLQIKKAMKKHFPQIEQMKEKYMVTLTAQTVNPQKLPTRLKNMAIAWRRITDHALKINLQMNGIRKLEVISSFPNEGKECFNAHYHILVDSLEAVHYLIEKWLSTMPKIEPGIKIDPKAQDFQVADNNSILELFKYIQKASKHIKTDSSGTRIKRNRKNQVFSVTNDQEVKLHMNMAGRRKYQPFGNLFNPKISKLKKS